MSIMYNSSIRSESPIQRRVADVRSHSSGCWVLCWSTNQDGFQGAILMRQAYSHILESNITIVHSYVNDGDKLYYGVLDENDANDNSMWIIFSEYSLTFLD